MPGDRLIQLWLQNVREGDERSAEAIWNAFYPRLVQLAFFELRVTSRRVEDEEDVVLSAMQSFFKAAKLGRFEEVDDAASLWRLLSEMTRRKVVDRIRRNKALKNGGNKVHGDSIYAAGPDSERSRLAEVAADEIAADVQAIFTEQLGQWLAALEQTEPLLKELALAKMEGYTNVELSKMFDRSVPTIERWLRRIRRLSASFWEES